MNRLTMPAAALAASLAASAWAAPPAYKIKPLKSTDTIQPVVAYGINRQGVVVGSAWNFVIGRYVCFQYVAGQVSELPDSVDRVCTGINDRGDIVGGPDTAVGVDDGLSYLWPAEGGRQELVGMASAVAINNAGHISGWATFGGTLRHAALYADGVLTDLGAPRGSKSSSVAHALNDKGLVVGTGSTRDGATQALKWYAGAMKKIPPLNGTVNTAQAVNRQGHVVGTTGVDSIDFGGYLQDGDGVHALPPVPNTTQMTPRAVNDSDVVVGKMTSANLRDVAFYSSQGKSYWLFGLLDASGAGWTTLNEANGINASGQIVGEGFYEGHAGVPFVATPVVP